MATSYTGHLHLAKPAQGDTDWAGEVNPNYDAVDHILARDRTYFVCSQYTEANVFTQGLPGGNERRHFDTIQGAVNEAESKGWGANGYAVLIAPGIYSEKVTLKKSASLINWAGTGAGYYVGGQCQIRGNGNAEAVIKCEPQDGEFVRLGLYGLQIDNQYDTTDATENTAEPYAVWFADQAGVGTYGSQANFCTIKNCAFRCQTWGDDNCWQSAIRIRGWWGVVAQDSFLQTLTWGGGGDDGWIRRGWDVYGDPGEPKTSTLRLIRTGTSILVPGSGSPPTQYAYALLGNAQIHLIYSWCNQTSASSWFEQSSGNFRSGFADSGKDDLEYRNSFDNTVVPF